MLCLITMNGLQEGITLVMSQEYHPDCNITPSSLDLANL